LFVTQLRQNNFVKGSGAGEIGDRYGDVVDHWSLALI
jgi:hypothetical protein